jgi:hypothetical protein
MAVFLPAGTVTRAKKAGLASARAAQALKDEDFISPAFAEPLGYGVPGLVIAIFPTAGRRPGGINMCRPASLIIRVSLPDAKTAFSHVTSANAIPGIRSDGYIGSFATDPPQSIADYDKDQSDWDKALDRCANAVAANLDSPDRALLAGIYQRLPWSMLRPTYAAMAPGFLRWLRV